MIQVVKHTTINLLILALLFLPIRVNAQITTEEATAIDKAAGRKGDIPRESGLCPGGSLSRASFGMTRYLLKNSPTSLFFAAMASWPRAMPPSLEGM